MTPPDGPRVLLLAAELVCGGYWRYTYSVAPGTTVTVVTIPGPGTPRPADPVMAQIVNSLARRPP